MPTRSLAIHPERFLLDAAGRIRASLDYETTLRAIAAAAVPDFATWCVVEVIEPDGHGARALVAHADPDRETAANRVVQRLWVDAAAHYRRHLLSLPPGLHDDPAGRRVAGIAGDAEHAAVLERLGPGSAIVVPCWQWEEAQGTITFVSDHRRGPYVPADVAIAQELARQATIALIHAWEYRQARQATQARDELLSVAGHELRGPLTVMRGYAQRAMRQVARLEAERSSQLHEGITMVDAQAEKLSQLVSRLFDLSRITAGQFVLERSDTDIAALVRGVVEATRLGGSHLVDHRIVTALPGEPLIAHVDPLRIEQLLSNLLENAVKYSPAGGEIAVEAAPAATGAVRISVRDHGLGIPAEHRARIFERYYRVDAAGGIAGTGLGLYICRQIVELHGGRIEVETPDDGGTRIIVTLPRRGEAPGSIEGGKDGAATSLPAAAPDPASPGGTAGNDQAQPPAIHRTPAPDVEGRIAGDAGGGPHVLVVDDSRDIRELITTALTDEGYAVRASASAIEALAEVEAHPPDVILLNLCMLRLDGWAFARSYRARHGGRAPILVITGAHDGVERATALGVASCLTKPFDMDELLEEVRRLTS